jgi:hypothetical protein
VNVLHNMVEAVRPSGVVLDLQVIRPNPRVEADGAYVCEIDGRALFEKADAATAAVDALVESGRLREDAVDVHDVRSHYTDGSDLIDDFEDKTRSLPAEAIPRLRGIRRPVVVRERCRLRRLVVEELSGGC